MRSLSPIIEKAIATATVLHSTQKRKGTGLPYIIHPFSVAYMVSKHTHDDETIAAALLHDVLEDVGEDIYSADSMRKDFGDKVLSIVQSLSEGKIAYMSRDEKKATWLERKNSYFDKLRSATEEALLICAADKIHNLHSLIEDYKSQGESLWEVFDSPADKRKWFYEESLAILRSKLNSTLVDEFASLLEESSSVIAW